MLTNSDFRTLKATFVTKVELSASVRELLDYIADVRNELKNDILTFKDEILHEIQAMREEQAMFLGHRDTLEDHEKRITSLEKKSN